MWSEDGSYRSRPMCGGLKAGCDCITCTDVQWTLDNNTDDLFQDYVDTHVKCSFGEFKYWCKHRLSHGWG